MEKLTVKNLIIIAFSLFAGLSGSFSQVVYKEGLEHGNERSLKLTRMLDGGNESFFCYRSQKDEGSVFFSIEKYKKDDLSLVFSQTINTLEDARGARIDDIQFASGTIFIFRQLYNKEAQEMTLSFQTLSSAGILSKEVQEIIKIDCDHYEFVNFDFFLNPSKTKFLIKAVHKQYPNDEYKTDFIILDAVNLKNTGRKRVMQNLRSSGKQLVAYFGSFHDHRYGFSELFFDDDDKVYYCVTNPTENAKGQPKGCKLSFYSLSIDGDPVQVDLPIGAQNYVRDVQILKTGNNEIEVAGFFHEIVRLTDKKLVNCGLFNFKLNTVNNTITQKKFSPFDDITLQGLLSTKKKAVNFNYKLDDIIRVDNSVYYVGEQYMEERNGPFEWVYEYRNIILVKLNTNLEFQWVKYIPYRYKCRQKYRHIFMQYITYATDKNIHILFNDSPVNTSYYKKSGLNSRNVNNMEAIHGSDFVCNSINLNDGSWQRNALFRNKTYCFVPIRDMRPRFVLSSKEVLYLPLNKKSIYLHTEDRGKDKFNRLTFE